MEKELAMKWVEALRSGKYKQGIGSLRSRSNEYCCLGVLCEVEGLDFSVTDPESTNYYVKCGKNVNGANYPGRGIGSNSGLIPSLQKTLVGFNDNDRKSFSEIADIIEKYYEEL